MTLRWISLVPPAMVRQRLARNPNVHWPAAPTVVAPSGPSSSSPSSWVRWSCSTPSSLRTLASGPGSAPLSRQGRGPQTDGGHRVGLGHEGAQAVQQQVAGAERARRHPLGHQRHEGLDPAAERSRCPSTPARWPGSCGPGPPAVHVADDAVVGHQHAVQEHLVEHGQARQLAERADVDAGRRHVDDEVGDAQVLRRRGRCGPGRCPSRPRRPSWSTPSGRRAASRREHGWRGSSAPPGRARLRLAEQLAPGDLAAHRPDPRSCCSGVPWTAIVGAAQAPTIRCGTRTPARRSSWSMTTCSTAPASRPQGSAQCGTSSPASARRDRRWSAGRVRDGLHGRPHLGPQRLGPRGQVHRQVAADAGQRPRAAAARHGPAPPNSCRSASARRR